MNFLTSYARVDAVRRIAYREHGITRPALLALCKASLLGLPLFAMSVVHIASKDFSPRFRRAWALLDEKGLIEAVPTTAGKLWQITVKGKDLLALFEREYASLVPTPEVET